MKKLTFLFLTILVSFSVSGQMTFDWTVQSISEGNNLTGMNIVNDTTTILVGYDKTFVISADQGLTWDDVRLLDPEFDFGDISINSSGLGYACAGDVKVVDNPSNGEQDVYADGLLLKTTDFGATWSVMDINTIGPEEDTYLDYPNQDGCYATHFRSVEVLEDNSVFLSAEWYWHDPGTKERESIGGTFSSTDGVNWTAVVDSGFYSLAIEASPTNVYYGGLNHLFMADAATGNVTDIYDSITNDAGDLTVFISDITVVSDDEVYVVTTGNGIYKISDKGNGVEKLDGTGLPGGGNDMILVNENVWMILGGSTKSAITLDKGLNWTPFYPGSTIWEIGGIMNDSIVALAKSNIYKCALTDAIAGNNTWVSQEIKLNENMHKMHIIDDNNAIIAGYGQTLVSTSDGGVTWPSIETPELYVYGADYGFQGLSTVDTSSYAVTKRMYVVDYPVASPLSDVHAHGLIYKSTDLWQTWELLDYQNVGAGVDPALDPNAFGAYALDFRTVTNVNDTIAYIGARWLDTIAGYENKDEHSNVFRTEDGGDSWLPLFEDQGPSVFNSIHFLDEDNGYFLGNSFFRKTEDGGETFIDMYPALQTTGSPDDETLFLKQIVYVDENTWYILTSVDGIFVTTDGGVNYSELPGIGGGGGMALLNESTIIALGMATKSKISWDTGETWTVCYPGSTIWSIGGIMNDELVALAKSSLYKIPLADLEEPNNEADILTFELAEQTGDAEIDPGNNTISIEVQTGTDPSALSPTITISEDATVSPTTDVEQDFTNPVTYTVTAEDKATTEDWTVTVTIEVGIEEMTMDHILFYPNPVNDKLYLENLDKIERISLFSITGSSVLKMDAPSNAIVLDMSTIEEGIYFISFMDIEGGVSTKKVVKK